MNYDYSPGFLFKHHHISTIYPTFFRKPESLEWTRKAFDTPDGDFFHCDIAEQSSDKVCILLHGLEGSSQANYMRGMAAHFFSHGWDIIAMNFRGCSGEPNRTLTTYHSGFTNDLHQTVQWSQFRYTHVAIIGFSLGGNISVKYAGEQGENLPKCVKGIVAISVPMDLVSSGVCLEKPGTWVYRKRFLKSLINKAIQKHYQFPGNIQLENVRTSKTIREFDDRYTAPIHGFSDADDYYAKCSSRQFIPDIRVPTLVINARDDSFLREGCYPVKEAEENPFTTLLIPDHGGHCGFPRWKNGPYWSEEVAYTFIEKYRVV